MLGYPAEGIIGRSFLDLIDPQDRDVARQLFERSQLQPGVPTLGEVRMRPREDAQAPRHFEMTATDLLDDSTVSRWSTTASATTPETSSCATSRNGWPAAYGRETPSPPRR